MKTTTRKRADLKRAALALAAACDSLAAEIEFGILARARQRRLAVAARRAKERGRKAA